MAQWLQVLAVIPLALAARMRRLERRVIARVTEAGANTAERAVLLEDAGPVGDFVHRRLQRAGVLVFAGNGRYYLDADAYAAFCGARRRRAVIVIVVVLLVVALLIYRGDLS